MNIIIVLYIFIGLLWTVDVIRVLNNDGFDYRTIIASAIITASIWPVLIFIGVTLWLKER